MRLPRSRSGHRYTSFRAPRRGDLLDAPGREDSSQEGSPGGIGLGYATATVADLRKRLSEWRITTLGWVLIIVAPAALVVFVFGPRSLQAPALIVGLVVLFGIALEGSSMSKTRGLGGTRTLGEQRERLARELPASAPLTEATEAEEGLWQRERERRQRDASGE